MSNVTSRKDAGCINWHHVDVPDSSGAQVDLSPIMTCGQVAYGATLPHAEMVAAVNAAGIPAAVPFHAGTHLCNQMLYTTAHAIQKRGLQTLIGFIHVPQPPRNGAVMEGRNRQMASMSLAMTTHAIEICIATLATVLTARQTETV
ncbi:pyroglutamyl peptidase [Primorskyibacter sedentarius]|uniref:Pyrrolidone-carboxylate peptidase n=1 Tax=Primorskyibacter sedentarius TaxID=745311 RepID=A0A4R3JI87_9RHOB|nr:hypothetical protein [Primorskyibacter sedentarius]TCS65909.1 pyroglutamyl peptidase [Primorskyibacter sedentarius]